MSIIHPLDFCVYVLKTTQIQCSDYREALQLLNRAEDQELTDVISLLVSKVAPPKAPMAHPDSAC